MLTEVDHRSSVREILIVHEHRLFREGLRGLIETRSDLRVIAEATDGLGAVNLAGRLGPDVVLMQVSMSGLNAIEVTRQLLTLHPDIRIIGLARTGEERLAAQIVRAGGHGYIMEDDGRAQLMRAIDHAFGDPSNGNAGLDEPLSPPEEARVRLTARELEVLTLIADGYTTREIAGKLVVSPKTVETHRKHVMDKLEIRSIARLTKYAIRVGLTTLAPR